MHMHNCTLLHLHRRLSKMVCRLKLAFHYVRISVWHSQSNKLIPQYLPCVTFLWLTLLSFAGMETDLTRSGLRTLLRFPTAHLLHFKVVAMNYQDNVCVASVRDFLLWDGTGGMVCVVWNDWYPLVIWFQPARLELCPETLPPHEALCIGGWGVRHSISPHTSQCRYVCMYVGLLT